MKIKLLSMALVLLSLAVPVSAADLDATKPAPKAVFSPKDADTLFDSYNKAFYVVKDGKGYYKEDTAKGRNHFWTQAEEIEMILDTWERTRSPQHLQLVNESIRGFVDRWGTNWTSNHYNDDLMWMVIATSRAYLATTNSAYKEMATYNFQETYNRAWSTNLGGGLWWSTTNASKNACINGPGAIAACFLYQISHDQAYLDKAKACYAWERKNLFEESTGLIHDNMRADGQVRGGSLTYNQGTFIGAANFLAKYTGDKSYLADAEKAADHARDKMSKNGILPGYNFNDGLGFNSILIRWLSKFATDNHLWPKYHSWMLENANAAWKNRRTDNLSWNRLQTPTPDTEFKAWACTDAIVLLQMVPTEIPK